METIPEHKPDEVTKQLLRQLFELQFELEQSVEGFNEQTLKIIGIIDQLWERLLNDGKM